MCRLFAQISPLPLSAERYLANSDSSLLKQSNFDKKDLQKDGWGIAHFGNKNQPIVSKSAKAAFLEPEKFRESVRAISRVIIGHIRAASNPKGLPSARILNVDCAQPFTDGRWIFAHNGTLEIPDEVAGKLGPLKKRIRSSNDSEVYFWQFLKFYRKTGSVQGALEACLEEIRNLWARCQNRYPHKTIPYTSLNALISDGRRLYAFCHAIHRGLARCGICNPTQPWSVMSFARRGPRLLVASENMDRGAWTRFQQPELLSAEITSAGLRLKRVLLKVEVP
jgi:predicted glutamine amidotransferase